MTWNIKKIKQWIKDNPNTEPNPDARPGTPEEHAGLMLSFNPMAYDRLHREALIELREELMSD